MSEQTLLKTIQKWVIGGVISLMLTGIGGGLGFILLADKRLTDVEEEQKLKVNKQEFNSYKVLQETKDSHLVEDLREIKEDIKEINKKL